jgi:hypothetical protein
MPRGRARHGSIYVVMTIASPFHEIQVPTTAVYEYIFGDLAESDADRIAITEVTSD